MSGLSTKYLVSDLTEEIIPWQEGIFLFSLWQKKRVGSKLPARADFSPSEMTSILPHLILLDIHKNTGDSKVRLAGTYITSMMKDEITGEIISNLSASDQIIGRLTWILKHKKPYMLCSITPEWSKVDFKTYDVMVLPLASDGVTIDKVLGLVIECKK